MVRHVLEHLWIRDVADRPDPIVRFAICENAQIFITHNEPVLDVNTSRTQIETVRIWLASRSQQHDVANEVVYDLVVIMSGSAEIDPQSAVLAFNRMQGTVESDLPSFLCHPGELIRNGVVVVR